MEVELIPLYPEGQGHPWGCSAPPSETPWPLVRVWVPATQASLLFCPISCHLESLWSRFRLRAEITPPRLPILLVFSVFIFFITCSVFLAQFGENRTHQFLKLCTLESCACSWHPERTARAGMGCLPRRGRGRCAGLSRRRSCLSLLSSFINPTFI